MSSKPVLGYWELRARGRYIRTLLAFVGQDYVYQEYTQTDPKEWFARDKPRLGNPLANLPYWKDGDLTLMQSNAIMRHLARQHNLAGRTPIEISTADMLAEFFEDIRHTHINLCYYVDKNLFEGKKAAYLKNWRENHLPTIAKYLGENDFLLGSEISYVDFILHELLHVHGLFDPEMDLKTQASNLADFMQRFEAIPAIAEFAKKEDERKQTVYAGFANWSGFPKTSPVE